MFNNNFINNLLIKYYIEKFINKKASNYYYPKNVLLFLKILDLKFYEVLKIRKNKCITITYERTQINRKQ